MATKFARGVSLQTNLRGFTERSMILLACLMLVLSMFVVFLPSVVLAADEDFAAVSDKTGKPGQEISITDLQVSGTGDDEVSVRLLVDSGELYFDDWGGVDFHTESWGQNISFSGTRSEVNYSLEYLRYENREEGTYNIEVILGDGNLNSENRHVYQVIEDSGISWEDAKTAAENTTYGGVNGYLATITSEQEHDFIRERISDSGWIGATDAGVEGDWRWVTGPEGNEDSGDGLLFWVGDEEEGAAEPDQYENWNDGEPNDGGEGEDCGQIWFTESSDGLWNDLDCASEENEYYVVEFGGNTEESLPEIVSTSFDIVLSRDTIDVNSCDQLFALGAEHAGNNINLTSDIDCHGRTETPLFDEEDFTGTFNGNGFTIKNVNLVTEDNEHVGLTGYSIGATYKNIFLDNIGVKGDYHNGVLAGHVDESIIAENIHATNVRMEGVPGNEYVEEMGVLFGTVELNHEYESRIEHVSVQGSFNISDVSYVTGVGGLVGYIESEGDITIKQAYADVDIQINDVPDTTDVGGLVGYIEVDGEDDNTDKDVVQGISDSYSWGSISAPGGDSVGGLIGFVDSDNEDDADVEFNIDNSYSWMDLTASTNVGGLIGYMDTVDDAGGDYSNTITNSFYAGTVNGDSEIGIIIGSFEDFEEEISPLNFDNVWYDETKAGDYDCVSNMPVDECNAANVGGSQPNYFYNNRANAPMDQWDFTTVWRTNSGTPPVFKPFIGNDNDQDGVNNYIESRAPNGGDANNDGIQDNVQVNVASFVSSVTGAYVSVALSDECSVTKVGVSTESESTVKDIGYEYGFGLIGFAADCGDPGYTTTASVYQYSVDGSGLVLRKFNPNTNAYFTVEVAQLSQQTIDNKTVVVATYSITDGGILDVDGEANGTIVDPVGLANIVVGSPNTGTSNIKDLLFVR